MEKQLQSIAEGEKRKRKGERGGGCLGVGGGSDDDWIPIKKSCFLCIGIFMMNCSMGKICIERSTGVRRGRV